MPMTDQRLQVFLISRKGNHVCNFIDTQFGNLILFKSLDARKKAISIDLKKIHVVSLDLKNDSDSLCNEYFNAKLRLRKEYR